MYNVCLHFLFQCPNFFLPIPIPPPPPPLFLTLLPSLSPFSPPSSPLSFPLSTPLLPLSPLLSLPPFPSLYPSSPSLLSLPLFILPPSHLPSPPPDCVSPCERCYNTPDSCTRCIACVEIEVDDCYVNVINNETKLASTSCEESCSTHIQNAQPNADMFNFCGEGVSYQFPCHSSCKTGCWW